MNKLLWLLATYIVWRPRVYLATRALMGIPGEVVLRGPWRGEEIEVCGPSALRIQGPLTVGTLTARAYTTVRGSLR